LREGEVKGLEAPPGGDDQDPARAPSSVTRHDARETGYPSRSASSSRSFRRDDGGRHPLTTTTNSSLVALPRRHQTKNERSPREPAGRRAEDRAPPFATRVREDAPRHSAAIRARPSVPNVLNATVTRLLHRRSAFSPTWRPSHSSVDDTERGRRPRASSPIWDPRPDQSRRKKPRASVPFVACLG
jgi:hypothetical protein